MSNDIRDQLHTIQTEDLTPAQILSASGGVYLSKDAQDSQDEIVDIVATTKAVKSPFFGAPLPGTFEISVTPGTDTDVAVNIVSPTTNQTYELLAASAENLNPGGTAEGSLFITDGANSVKLAASGSISAQGEEKFNLSHIAGPLYFTKELYISGVPTAGTAAQLQFKLAYCKVVQ